MNKLTYGEAKAGLARILGMVSTDSRVKDYANEAARRLVARGKWVGTTLRYHLCVRGAGITWPRQIETIELFGVNDLPGIVRNEWYEFLGTGPGLMDTENSCLGRQLIDRGTACTFADITRGIITRKLKVISSVAETGSPRLLIRGYDENANWIRTQDAGAWIDGEYVAINSTGTLSTKYYTQVVNIVKPATNGKVTLTEWDSVGSVAVKSLATYEPDETLPVYRRSIIPGLEGMAICDSGACNQAEEERSVTVYCKLRYLPVINDNDFFLIGNLSALKHGVKAIQLEEKDMRGEAELWWQSAINELNRELESYMGDGAVNVPRMEDPLLFGGGGILTV